MSVARERPPCYNAAPQTPAQAAIAQLDAALAALAEVDWTREDSGSIRSAAVGMQRRVNQVCAQALRPVEQVEARSAFRTTGR